MTMPPASRSTRLAIGVRAFLAALLSVGLGGAESSWNIDLPIAPEAEQAIALGDAAFADDQALVLSYQRENTHDQHDVWVELSLLTSDGRYFASAEALTIPGENHRGELRVPLDAGHWSGRDGELGGDALAAVRQLRLRLHGTEPNGRLSGTLAVAAAAPRPGMALELLDGGMVERGPWRELRVRLLGSGGERGEVELVQDPAGGQRRRLPLFFDQPGIVVDGRWHARGPGRWVLRLRTDEALPPGCRISWSNGARHWTSAELPALAAAPGRDALPPPPPQALPVPEAPAWSGQPCTLAAGKARRIGRVELKPCPAPVLAWLSSWSGFRGPGAISYDEAAALDQLLAAGVAELDLLPQSLLEEHGPFRFGLAPWHRAQGGPWEVPQDAMRSQEPWRQWRAHVRDVVARARATPGLTRWRLGLTQPANAPAEVERLREVLAGLAQLVDGIDPRPVLALHPQAADFRMPDPAGAWFDFEDGLQGWRYGPLPFSGQPQVAAFSSDGKGSLRLAFPATPLPDGARAIGVMREVDVSLFNLDRLEFDAALTGGGSAQLYCWVTDNYHHWYQQRLDLIAGNRRWNTVGVDFTDGGAWQAAAGVAPWSAESRRRIRRIGIAAFYRAAPSERAAGEPELHLDRLRRLGWAAEDVPRLAMGDVAVAADAVACWEPIAADFRLNVEARNPYDPDSADVAGEVVAPDGRTIRYPAYWAEPFTLEMVGDSEQPRPAGAGAWHWRFAPTAPGAWRWRLVAKLRYRDQWLECAGAWRTTNVAAAAPGAMPPVRLAASDRTCFETADGKWFYPIGINLRSPGDSRQDRVMAEAATEQPRSPASSGMFRSAAYDKLGTRAYERWLAIMEQQHMNWARVWMCPWWCGIEWRRDWDGFGGLTVYNQGAAARLDRVMELARQHHVYVQLELQNHGMTSSHVDEQWQDSPYNALNGGPCHGDEEFFSSPAAWQVHQKRLRYTLARWGWNSNLAAWVLSSEMEFTGAWWVESRNGRLPNSPTTQAWVQKSLDWFTANDPMRGRPVSIHFSHPWEGEELWKLPGLGFSNSNAYTGFQQFNRLGGQRAGLGGALLSYLTEHFPPRELDRPTLIGEWGGHWEVNPSSILSAELHTGVWLQAVLPYAGNTGFWWWLWVDAEGRWSDYAPVAAFIAGEDRRGIAFTPHRPLVVCDRPHSAAIMGMKSEREHRYYAGLPGLSREFPQHGDQDAGIAQVVTEQPGSTWHAQRWDCAKGVVAAEFDLTADAQGVLSLPLGVLDPDAAFKLHRVNAGAH